jgi:hypothetical protein
MSTPLPIIVPVEIMPGTSIGTAATALCLAHDKLGLYVTAKFNGIRLTAGPRTLPSELVAQYDRLTAQK